MKGKEYEQESQFLGCICLDECNGRECNENYKEIL